VQSQRVSDSMYVAIEDRFRGDHEVIKERQRKYLGFLANLPKNSTILDLGPGRGEWLELVRDHGFSAIGIDTNTEFVASAKDRGLSVINCDLLEYVSSCSSGSIAAVTMFQVAEHLPLGVLEKVLAHVHRILQPGGLFIAEIPNIETLRVGGASFWIDPTHERPLFPEFLVFMVERSGFVQIQRLVSTPLSDTPPDVSAEFRLLFEQVNGPADFAVVGFK